MHIKDPILMINQFNPIDEFLNTPSFPEGTERESANAVRFPIEYLKVLVRKTENLVFPDCSRSLTIQLELFRRRQ